MDIEADEDDSNGTNDDTLVFNVGDMIAAVSLIPAPVPNGEAAECAKNNYMCRRPRRWPKLTRQTSWCRTRQGRIPLEEAAVCETVVCLLPPKERNRHIYKRRGVPAPFL